VLQCLKTSLLMPTSNCCTLPVNRA
jgi:hypothetical protein